MIRMLLTETSAGAAEGIRALLGAHEDLEIVGYPRDGLEAVQMAARLRPDILLVHDRLPGLSGAEACELTAQAAPEVACALLCEEADSSSLRRAMRAGARAVMTPALAPEEMAAILRDLAGVSTITQAPEYALATDPARMPQTVAVIAARDGVGKSTLTINLATALAAAAPEQVVVVDLCGQFSSLPLLLNLASSNSILDLADFAQDMDGDLLETFLGSAPAGFKILPGGSKYDPAWTDALGVEFLADLFGLLRRRYRFILCDIPCVVWPGSLYAITRSQYCLMVSGLSEVTAVRESAALADLLVPNHLPAERLRLVVNRVSTQEWFTEDDLKAATRLPVWHSLPYDAPSLFAAANEGVPVVVAKPNAPFAKGVAGLADKLLAELS